MNEQRRWLGIRLVAELAIIFVGVSAAFLVENYRQDLLDRRRATQHAEALYRDLASFADVVDRYVGTIRAGLAGTDSARAAGGRPAPYVLRVPGAEAPPIGVWQAALQSGAGEVLDADLLGALSSFYNEASGITTKYQRYALFAEREVWPRLAAADTAAFYDPATGSPRAEYVAHRWQLEELLTDLTSQADAARALMQRIAETYPQVRGNDPD